MFDVVKLGGSLLSDAGWPRRFETWLALRPTRRILLIVGGGEMIDAMRRLDARYSLDAAAMHWRCVRMLSHTADVAAELLRRETTLAVARLTTLHELAAQTSRWCEAKDASERPQVVIADADAFYRPDLSEQLALLSPHFAGHLRPGSIVDFPTVGWQTTTDAIAVFAATLLGAGECVLLKSCPVVDHRDLNAAAAAGVIDPEAARLAGTGIKVSLVRL